MSTTVSSTMSSKAASHKRLGRKGPGLKRPGAVLCLLTAMLSGTVWAEACTYREALMALEQGNSVRGLALMRIARRDGDRRAEDYLLQRDLPLTADGNDERPLATLLSEWRVSDTSGR